MDFIRDCHHGGGPFSVVPGESPVVSGCFFVKISHLYFQCNLVY